MKAATALNHPMLADLDRLLEASPDLLGPVRGRAAARFEALGLPTRRTEEWRFTNVARLADVRWTVAERGDLPDIDLGPPVAGRHRLVVVDGWLRPELSHLDGLPEGVLAGSLVEAADRSPERVEPHLARHAELHDHPFAALNAAQFRDGVLLWLPDGIAVEEPIEVLLVAAEHREPTMVVPRLLVVAGRGSQASVVQRSVGGGGRTFTCTTAELVLGEGSVLDHALLLEDHRDATHISALEARQERDSALRSSVVTVGGGLVRNDLAVSLRGTGADATLDGLSLASSHQHVDSQLRVHHGMPHCTSHQLYKGVLDGSARAVFNGRIVVDPGAQKTDARQTNRNLLLSDTALVNSNPQLEIFADDVRCTHGSTVGRLDEDAVFYLRSRGLDRPAAESLLTWAFAAEVMDRIRAGGVRQRARELVLERLPNADLIREVV